MNSIQQNKQAIRKKQLKDGFFDGRFVARTHDDKKHKRKKKTTRQYLNERY